ncbi:MAG: ATP-dependent DNA helicase [archaeon]|nr:ATP-dependent DNA helicase [Nanoarchaeota archaeon]
MVDKNKLNLQFFPHLEVRPGQDELIFDLTQALAEGKCILANAPTGLGKTASAISVALSYLYNHKSSDDGVNGFDKKKKIFFLTNRHTQHKIAVDTLRQVRAKTGEQLICVDLIGKKWMCNQEVASLFGTDFNEYCKSVVEKKECEFYNNVRDKNGLSVDAKYALAQLKESGVLHNEELKRFSEEKKMCAYELSMALAKKAQVIVGDYYYLFNPAVLNNILGKLGIEVEDCIIIVDEAHNLPGRVTEMMSSYLTTNMLKNGILEAKKYRMDGLIYWLNELKKIVNDLADFEDVGFRSSYSSNKYASNKPKQINASLSGFSSAADLKNGKVNNGNKTGYASTNKERLVKKDEFMEKVQAITDYNDLIGELEGAAEEVRKRQKRSQLGGIANFLIEWAKEDHGFSRMIVEKDSPKFGKMTILQYACLDPSLTTKNVFARANAAILMSGTLSPTFMYRDLLGIERGVMKDYSSPFPIENRVTLVVPETSTKYNLRNETMFRSIAEHCSKISRLVPGNLAFFFPSYHLRDKIAPFIEVGNKEMFLEQQEMTKEDKELFLQKFKAASLRGGVLLGVAGANFAEGVDLPGNLLQGVVVVGLPLASPDLKTKQTINYYEDQFQKGWDYAYLFPAMNKCLQSAGRCIRSGTDRGVIIYLDERFAWQRYYEHLPREGLIVTKNYPELLKKFYAK